MGRFGRLTCEFYAPGNSVTSLQDGSGNRYLYPVSAESTAGGTLNETGAATIRVPYNDYWADLIAEGNICVAYYTDSVLTGSYPLGVPFGGAFVIESVTPSEEYIEFTGPCLLEELKKGEPAFHPIGEETIIATTVDTAVAAPLETTASLGCPAGSNGIWLTDDSGIEEGDEIRIQMNGGAWHVATTTTAANVVEFTPRIIASADMGNDVEIRKTRLVLDSVDDLAAGQRVIIALNTGTLETLITEVNIDDLSISIQDGLPTAVDSGKAVTAYDYSEPATDDIEQIMDYAAGWTAYYDSPGYTGTEDGTAHVPDGDSAYTLLQDAARQSGETFRLDVSSVPGVFIRAIQWERTPVAATYGSNTLITLPPSYGDAESSGSNPAHRIIGSRLGIIRRWAYRPVSRVYPISGDDRVSLTTLKAADLSIITGAGYTLVTDPATIGLYGRPYIKSTSMESDPDIGIRGAVVSFSHIRTDSDGLEQIQAASAALAREAVAYMRAHAIGRIFYDVPDVIGAPLYPNTAVDVTYQDPTGWSITATGYVVAVAWSYDAENGPSIPFMQVTVSNTPGHESDDAAAVGRSMRNVERYIRRNAGGSGSSTTIISTVGGTAGDHGALTGLGDDDHSQYLLVNGGRALTGNLAVNGGVTIDGVDISAHAANAAAHHALVTSSSSAIEVSGQTLTFALRADSGLQISSGVGVLLRSSSGLSIDGTGLGVQLLTNSGLILNTTGLSLSTPSTLNADSTNTIGAVGHSHAITAYADSRTNYGALLKSDAEGGLTLHRLSVGGVATSSLATAYLQSFAVDDYTLYLKQLAGQTADVWRVEDSGGNALIRLTGGGDLESGTPGFVSGMTGWQITSGGDAEFNNAFIRGELHATTFVADEMHATGGTLAVMTAAKVAPPVYGTDNVIPTLGGTFFLNVQASYDTGLCYFAANDLIRIKPMGEIVSGGSLDLYDLYIQVSSTGTLAGRNLSEGDPGYYRMTCIFRRGGTLGGTTGNATGFEIPAGSAAVRWTKLSQGTGTYTGGLILTSDLNNAPYVDVFTIDSSKSGPQWQSALVNPTPRVRLGNLAGVLGKSSDEWGIAAGTDLSATSTAARYLVASDLGLELRNVDLEMYSGGERIIRMSTDGMTIQTGTSSFEPDKSIRWLNSVGDVVGALSVRNSSVSALYYMEIGLRPTFSDVLSDIGIRIYDNFTGDTFIDINADETTVSGGLSVATGLGVGGYISATGAIRTADGLSVGDTSLDPAEGAIYLKERSSTTFPPANTASLWVQDVSGQQKLYVKFENGAVRELASS